MQVAYSLLAIVAAYMVGSLSFAVIVSRMMGLADPRGYGSGNPGATNVLRSGNRAAAVLTLCLDALKGALPVALTMAYGARFGLGAWTVAAVGVAAFVGHLWPLFFNFKGGKGVATAAGVLLAFNPWLGLATVASWLLIAAFFRYSSLASIVAALFAPFYQLLIWGVQPVLLAIAVMSLLLIWRHEGNIRKLLAGSESRLGQRPKPAAPAKAPHAQSHAQPHSQAHSNKKGRR